MRVYLTREIKEENFTPMVWNLLDADFARDHVQVMTYCFNKLAWITVHKSELE